MVKIFFFIKSLSYKYLPSFSISYQDAGIDQETSSMPFNLSMKKEFLKMGGSLILLLVFLFFSVWLFKKILKSKSNMFNKSSLIKIIDKRAITQKSSVYIIQVANKLLILSESPAGLQYISELSSEANLNELFQENNEKKAKLFPSRDIILQSLKKLKGNALDKN